MPNRIQHGRPLPNEVRRLFDEQIVDAVSCISQRREPASRVNDARKHVKKARAILQLARPASGRAYAEADEALRLVNRALGPLADAHRLGETLDAVSRLASVHLPPPTLAALRVRLAANGSAVMERATREAIRARTIRLLDSTRRQALGWDLSALDRDAILKEIARMHAASRGARRLARLRPSTETHHAWRRRVKREAYALRAIGDMVGGRLKDERHQLAALDTCLGDLHDVMVLIETIAADSPLSRAATAATLRELRAVARDHRRRGHAIAVVLNERPRDFARRLRVLWGIPPRRAVARQPVQPWLRRA